jgi:hypothetical protein
MESPFSSTSHLTRSARLCTTSARYEHCTLHGLCVWLCSAVGAGAGLQDLSPVCSLPFPSGAHTRPSLSSVARPSPPSSHHQPSPTSPLPPSAHFSVSLRLPLGCLASTPPAHRHHRPHTGLRVRGSTVPQHGQTPPRHGAPRRSTVSDNTPAHQRGRRGRGSAGLAASLQPDRVPTFTPPSLLPWRPPPLHDLESPRRAPSVPPSNPPAATRPSSPL